MSQVPERNRGTRDDARRNLEAVDAGDGCSLLLFAASGWKQGEPIDRIIGRLGWSHLAIDADEEDARTGEPLIIDHRVGVGMQRRPYLPAEYRDRPHARIVLPQPLAMEVRLAAKRLVGSRYRARSALRHLGDGDLGGTVCSQVVYECLPPDLQRHLRESRPPLGLVGRSLRRWNPYLITPNQFAVAFGVPAADIVGPKGATMQAAAVAADEVQPLAPLERVTKIAGPLATSLAHRGDCRLISRVVSIKIEPGSDDLGNHWQFKFDVNGRGPSTVRSRRLSIRSPLINPRKIIYHEWVPHCAGTLDLNVSTNVAQFQGINDTGAAQTNPIWTVACPGQSFRDLQVHVDGRHEHAELSIRVLVQAFHAHRHPD